MSEVAQLLQLFRVEKQLRGLRKRLTAAERFLAAQQNQLTEVTTKRNDLIEQMTGLKVAVADQEGESQRLDARIEELREKLNQTKTTKEYNALLTELNTYKESKSEAEEHALTAMGGIDTMQAEIDEMGSSFEERTKIVQGAEADRVAKEAEIADRLGELTTQRDELADNVDKRALGLLREQIERQGDEAMSPVEVLDRRNKEFSCGSCMMTLPIESVSNVLSGRLTQCVSCHCILFCEEDILSTKKKAAAKA